QTVPDGRVGRELLSAGSTASKASGVGAAKVPLANPYDSQRRLKACHGRQQTWRESAPAAEINNPATTVFTVLCSDGRPTDEVVIPNVDPNRKNQFILFSLD